jgi:hypothetical protein
MTQMFHGASLFGSDLDGWDVQTNRTEVEAMFDGSLLEVNSL